MALQLDSHTPKKRFPFISVFIFLILLALAGFAGYILYSWYTKGETPIDIPLLASADTRVNETPVSEKEVNEYTVEPSHARYLSIPSLGISRTRVLSGGVTEQNQLVAPDRIDDTMWYNKSATPGSGDAILINGHNGGVRRDGVFAKLSSLKAGDIIKLERGDGKTFRYEVLENQSLSLDEVNRTGMQMMMRSAEDGKEGLNLITCDGKWVPRYQQFDRRIMLRAVLIE